MGFQAMKCRYIEGSKNGPVTGPYGPVNFYLCKTLYCTLVMMRWLTLKEHRVVVL